MAKDPAFLFYWQDFLNGTQFMSLEAIGAYVKALCYQADKGSIPKNHMSIICQSRDNVMSEVCSKFVEDINGNLYNVRLSEEVEKRKRYSESRRKNRLSSKKTDKKSKSTNKKISQSYVKHMENENENGDVNENNNIGVVLPFETERFKKHWDLWKDYKKKEFKFNFKSIQSEQAQLKELAKKSNGDELLAIDILDQSMANGWKGIFNKKRSGERLTEDQKRAIIADRNI